MIGLSKDQFFFFLQAYTVELEAELNQLKEENAHLKQALVVNILAEISLILEYDFIRTLHHIYNHYILYYELKMFFFLFFLLCRRSSRGKGNNR